MSRLRCFLALASLLALSTAWVFADAALPEETGGQSLVMKFLTLACGAICGIIIGRYLVKRRRGK